MNERLTYKFEAFLYEQVADGEEEQRIHERKGMTLLKDLKKQLAMERKRADRLQEKLSQLLTDPAQLTAITSQFLCEKRTH